MPFLFPNFFLTWSRLAQRSVCWNYSVLICFRGCLLWLTVFVTPRSFAQTDRSLMPWHLPATDVVPRHMIPAVYIDRYVSERIKHICDSFVVIFRLPESFISMTTIPVRCKSELNYWSCKQNIFGANDGVLFSFNRRSRLFIGSQLH